MTLQEFKVISCLLFFVFVSLLSMIFLLISSEIDDETDEIMGKIEHILDTKRHLIEENKIDHMINNFIRYLIKRQRKMQRNK